MHTYNNNNNNNKKKKKKKKNIPSCHKLRTRGKIKTT